MRGRTDRLSARRAVARARRLAARGHRLATRDPRLLWAHPRANAVRARLAGRLHHAGAVPSELDGRITVHRDVVSVPLVPGRDRAFSGGLLDGRTRHLLPEAVHLDTGEPQQEEADPLALTAGSRLPEFRVPVLYGGLLHGHFGHFLLESLGRLWAHEQVRGLDPHVAFHPGYGRLDLLGKRGFVEQTLTGLGIPMDRVLLLDSPVRLAHVLVPEQMYGYGLCRNPPDTFVEFVRGFSFPHSVPEGLEGATRVYVSRSALPGRLGRPMGETLFEEYLRGEGYAVLHPERHSLYEQLTVYSRAEQIVFCDGAALHGCVLLPDLAARVAVVARRRDPRWDLSRIVDQFHGYGQDVTWIDAVRRQYQFGLDSWDARALVDWYEVSTSLRDAGFTEAEFTGFGDVDVPALVEAEVRDFAAAVRDDPRFTRFLATLEE
ncbi:Protein of unknown function [Geodermatophilus saharensis]|uniref:Glycosyltransferase 61 catalytic domain-containing protein n=1 Tax=Geodermatophilus saharensis TaxID=1137994 RepID=A0A239IR47_9ACTN|nr:glycosyltransferase 61 family protein [Geodermatophilus saharensis]SNS96015.1 Protein of unknown function [Geodermatophilus saharensis]